MKIFSILFFALLTANFLSAQVRTTSNVTFEDATMMAYELDLNASSDQVIDLWDRYWDKQHDVDVDREDRNREREVYMAENVEVAAIANKPMDVYSKISKGDDSSTTLSFGIGFGYEIYASNRNYRKEFAAAKDVLEDFEQYFYREYYAEKLATMRGHLDDAKDEVEDMNSTIAKNDRQIERWKADIEKAKENIVEAEEETQNTQEALEGQKKTVSTLEMELKELEQMASKWQNK